MIAKRNLLTKLKYIDSAIQEPLLIDNGVDENEHNGIANLLRKGIGIVAFNILEDFIKSRTIEALETLSNSSITFAKLTTFLQEASIKEALNSLNSKANILKKNEENWKELIQDEAFKIHSTRLDSFKLSSYSLVSSGSNISSKEVANVIKAFGIDNGWTQIGAVASAIGSGIPNLAQVYINAATRRHSSAHVVSFQYDHAWLREIKNDIISIAASFDILLIARMRQIENNNSITINNHNINDALNYRYLEANSNDNKYRETTLIRGRARKIWNTFDESVLELRRQLVRRKEFLIVLNSHGKIQEWYSE